MIDGAGGQAQALRLLSPGTLAPAPRMFTHDWISQSQSQSASPRLSSLYFSHMEVWALPGELVQLSPCHLVSILPGCCF